MTHNTREWEDQFNSLWKSTSAWNLHPHDSQPVIQFIHHQLQKAREKTIHRIVAIVSSKQNQFTSTYERGYQDCVRDILESINHYQSKIDKLKK